MKTINECIEAAKVLLPTLPFGEPMSNERAKRLACEAAIEHLITAKRALIFLSILPVGIATSDSRPDGTVDVKLDPHNFGG